MGLHVAVEIHGHEARQLQEARIDLPAAGRPRPGHVGDDVAAKPIGAALLGQRVHHGGIDARVDGSAGQYQRQRHARIAVGFHQCSRSQHGHRWLAHRKHMHVAAKKAEHIHHQVDVVVEIEPACRQRHVARVLPIGDVDVVVGQKRLDRAAQQRCKVAGHGRHEQQARMGSRTPRIDAALEVHQPARGMLPDNLLGDSHRHAVDNRVGDAECRLGIAAGGALENFAGRDRIAAEGRMRPRVQRIEEQAHRIGGDPCRPDRNAAQLIPVVEHGSVPRCSSQGPSGHPHRSWRCGYKPERQPKRQCPSS